MTIFRSMFCLSAHMGHSLSSVVKVFLSIINCNLMLLLNMLNSFVLLPDALDTE